MESEYQFPRSLSSGKFRDPSFSSYLNGDGDADADADGDGQAVVKLDELTLSRSYQNGRASTEDEISVFSADKYFNEEVAENNVNAVTHPVRFQISLGTPSTRSESSWHSQSALLHSTGEIQRKKSLLYRLSCRCSCASKKSIKVDDNHAKSPASKESIRPGSSRADQVLKLSPKLPQKSWMKYSMKTLHPEVEKNPSPKLVNCVTTGSPYTTNSFDSPAIVKIGKSKSHQRMQNILNWDDSNTRSDGTLYNPSDKSVEYFTDAESDTSSDLFEIDSFTGHRKPSFSDKVPDSSASGYATATTGYAPSETNLANAADFPMLSDCQEFKPATPITNTQNSREIVNGIYKRNIENAGRGHSLISSEKTTETEENVTCHQRMLIASRTHSNRQSEISHFK